MHTRDPCSCCTECFSHPWVRQHIRQKSTVTGRCDYCGAQDVSLIQVRELCPYFENLLQMYEPYLGEPFTIGEELIWRIQWTWDVFDEATLDESQQARLLEDIANSGWDDDSGDPPLDANALYVTRGAPWHSSHAELWGEFCDAVRRKPDQPLPFHEGYDENFGLVETVLPSGNVLFRARRGYRPHESDRRAPYSGMDIGAPPPDEASASRANREGHSVLYCADQEKTAIAECRPAKGLWLSVCSLQLNREVRILDLAQEVKKPNPFLNESPLYALEVMGLLYALADEMTKPLERDDDTTHYVPCQRLAEYIEEAGYAGIRYPSAMNPGGTNVVLFDPQVARILPSKLVEVTDVSVEYVSETEDPTRD